VAVVIVVVIVLIAVVIVVVELTGHTQLIECPSSFN